MPSHSKNPKSKAGVLDPEALDPEAMWAAVAARDTFFDGRFVYSVATTGVYCRPSCPSRLAKRKNVRFHAGPIEAGVAGFRACKRCEPDSAGMAHSLASKVAAAKVAAACRLIETAETPPSLGELADAAGLSRFHFQRQFKSVTGVTPKAYALADRQRRVQLSLGRSRTVTDAIQNAGYNSNGRFYANASEVLGMTPKTFRAGGANADIRFAVGECSLGSVLVAATDRGVCAILLGDAPEPLVRDLEHRFPNANLIGGDKDFEKRVAKVAGFVDRPARGLDLPLDIQGTAFQHRVWDALRRIPPGSTASYSDIAGKIGKPKAVRAVAGACAANAIAVAIPCHRVVRTDGSLSGYRWGIARKRALLAKEAKR